MLQWSGILNSWVIGLRALLEFTSDIGSYYPVHVSQIFTSDLIQQNEKLQNYRRFDIHKFKDIFMQLEIWETIL